MCERSVVWAPPCLVGGSDSSAKPRTRRRPNTAAPCGERPLGGGERLVARFQRAVWTEAAQTARLSRELAGAQATPRATQSDRHSEVEEIGGPLRGPLDWGTRERFAPRAPRRGPFGLDSLIDVCANASLRALRGRNLSFGEKIIFLGLVKFRLSW